MAELFYGREIKSISFPGEKNAIWVKPKEMTPSLTEPQKSVLEIVADAIDAPIGSPPLSEIIEKGDSVCILVSDITRLWQKTNEYLPLLLNRLNSYGVQDKDILVLIAVGTHRKQTEEEHKKIVGEEVYRRVRIIDHDCDDDSNLIEVGITSFGNCVRLNAHAMACKKLILTGGVVPHFLAGYGGGGKSILPGIAARSTTNTNHNLVLNPGLGAGINPHVYSGSLTENPMRKDIEEAVAMANPCFMINVVADADNQVVKAFAGHYLEAFHAAVHFTENLCAVPVEKKAPLVVVSAGGFPRDINLRQSTKSLHHAILVAKPNATIILFAECNDGFGDEQSYNQIVNFTDMISREEALRKNFTVGAFVGFYFASSAEKYNIILVSSLQKKLFENTKMHVANSPEEALQIAKKLNPGILDTPTIFIANGGTTLPKLIAN